MSAVFAMACASSIESIDLETLASAPSSFEGQAVRTCGFVTNEFEDRNITLERETPERLQGLGLGVEWREGAGTTDGPEWRCIIGEIRPVGWPHVQASEGYTIMSTGTPFQWVVVQR